MSDVLNRHVTRAFRTMTPTGTLVIVVKRVQCFSALLTPDIAPPITPLPPPIPPPPLPTGPVCTTHREPLRAFCITCGKSICADCAIDSSLCKSHDTKSLSAIVGSARSELDAWLQVNPPRNETKTAFVYLRTVIPFRCVTSVRGSCKRRAIASAPPPTRASRVTRRGCVRRRPGCCR